MLAVFAIAFTFFACTKAEEEQSTSSDSSTQSNSSSKVYCKLSTGVCKQMSAETCMELVLSGEAEIVQKCPTGSSSSKPSNSTSSSSSSPTGGGDDEELLVRKSFTLSFAGASYGDLDVAKTYKQSELAGKKENIDIVAYYASGSSDDIINPCLVTTIGPDDCGDPELYPIPAKYWASLKSAKKVSEIADFVEAFANDEITGEFDENEVLGIDIAKNKAFLVYSTDGEYYVVVITDTGAQTVSLNFF